MLIPIPTRRRTLLWDPASGEVTRLSELESALLAEVPRPMPAVCPTSTRYAVAKYDSAEVDEAYAALRTRFAEAAEPTAQPILTIPTGMTPAVAETVLAAAQAAFPGQSIDLRADDAILAFLHKSKPTLA